MGEAVDVVWLDEEPKQEIFSQCITRTADTDGIVYMTFTPESGMTQVVSSFLNELKPGQSMVTATWDDVKHLDSKTKEQLLAVYSPAFYYLFVIHYITLYGAAKLFVSTSSY